MTVKDTAGNIIRFTNNTAGIEKILKGFIGILLLPQTPTGKSALPLSTRADGKLQLLTKNVSVARKIVRVLYFFDSAFKAIDAKNGHKGGLLKWLIVGKWAFTFVFASTEAVTILHTMEVLKSQKSRWHDKLTRTANKFYFVAICFSIAAAVVELVEIQKEKLRLKRERRKLALTPHASRPGTQYNSPSLSDFSSSSASESDRTGVRRRTIYPASSHRPAEPTSSRGMASYLAQAEAQEVGVDAARIQNTTNALMPKERTVVAHLLADICDLCIPASRIGLFENKEAVSLAHIFNGLLAGSVIWGRVNAKTIKTDSAPKQNGAAPAPYNPDKERALLRDRRAQYYNRDGYNYGPDPRSYQSYYNGNGQAVYSNGNGHVVHPGDEDTDKPTPLPRPRSYSSGSQKYPPLPQSEDGRSDYNGTR